MSKVQVAIYHKPNSLSFGWTSAFAEGLQRHGVQVVAREAIQTKSWGQEFRPDVLKDADLHVFRYLRMPGVIQHCQENSQPFVCLDNGYTQDRNKFASINLNGLNGRSELDLSDFASDNSRCVQHGWKIAAHQSTGKRVILVGQISGDSALENTDIYDWAKRKIAEFKAQGIPAEDILFKPHPQEWLLSKLRSKRVGAKIFKGSMEDAFQQAQTIVTYSSTAGASAWLNGVLATADSPVSMIYRAQGDEQLPKEKWLQELSFRQFEIDELRSGHAWDLLGTRIIGHASRQVPPAKTL